LDWDKLGQNILLDLKKSTHKLKWLMIA